MRIPSSGYTPTCPDCGRKARITIVDAGAYWVSGVEWKCPFCRRSHTTDELHAEERRRNRKPSPHPCA